MLQPKVSIITPVHNAELWLKECLSSITQQTYAGPMELCIYDDASTDKSMDIVKFMMSGLTERGIKVVLLHGQSSLPQGCGFAKNRAVESSSGDFLCFFDADDVMDKDRIEAQLLAAQSLPNTTLIGCQVKREPPSSTIRYTNWINNLDSKQLYTQVYTSNGPTIVMPTWFCHRKVFDIVGGFNEGGHGVPEDYIFFLRFLELGGWLHRVDKIMLTYRHHPSATTFSVSENTIWKLRVEALEKNVLCKWSRFTIWNAGKQGRKFYRDLCDENKAKVAGFCDVDHRKIKLGMYTYELSPQTPKPKIPIVHFSNAQKPFVLCVKLGMTNGAFEQNLDSLNIVEGEDYIVFS